jgi:hypothetical protein
MINAAQAKNSSADRVDLFSLFSGSGSGRIGSSSNDRAITAPDDDWLGTEASETFPNGYYIIEGVKYAMP